MANRTDPLAKTVHGTNPQNLVEKIVRSKIYQTTYWKQHCFALTAETLVDKAVDLKYVGGTYGGAQKPSEFLCLILKMLQIQPDKEIIIEFIRNEDYKYVRLLGAFYLRLVGKPLEVYQYLEPLYNDYRKVRHRLSDGTATLSHVDEVVDDMIRKDWLFEIALPRIPSRLTLEKIGQLEPRLSALAEDFDEAVLKEEAEEAAAAAAKIEAELAQAATAAAAAAANGAARVERSSRGDSGRHRERSRSRERRRSRSREREHRRSDRDKDRERERERERRGERDRDSRVDRDMRDMRLEDDDERRTRRRSRSRERDRADRGGSSRGGGGGSSRGGEPPKSRKADQSDPEIAAENERRAALGLKPLR